MLLKSDVPVSHRLALVVAVTLTVKVLVDLRTGFSIMDLCLATALWLIVLYTSMKRRRWRAQEAGGNIQGRFNKVDRMLQPVQTRFQEASITSRAVYWVAVTLAAILMYSLSR